MPLLCPGCRSELTPEANMCGVCLRQRDRNEIFRGIRQLQEEQKSARRKPYIVTGTVLAVAVLGAAAYRFGPQLQALLNPPRQAAPAPAAAPAPSPEIAAPAPAEEPAPAPETAAPLTNEMPPELARMYARKKAGVAEPVETPKDAVWSVKGQAYDLLSLKPIRGVQLIFTSPAGKNFAARTGADGRYSIKLPPVVEGGYKVNASHPDYRPSFLEETEPPYKRQSEARRVEAARLIINSEVLHVPLQMPEGASEAVYDLVLSPLPD